MFNLSHLGHPTVMATVDWTNLSRSVQDLQRNISTIELLINLVCRYFIYGRLSKIDSSGWAHNMASISFIIRVNK